MTWKLSLTNPDRTNGLGANRAVTGSRRGEDGINTPTSPSVGLLFVTKDRGVLVIVGILKIMSAAIQFPCRNCQRRPQPYQPSIKCKHSMQDDQKKIQARRRMKNFLTPILLRCNLRFGQREEVFIFINSLTVFLRTFITAFVFLVEFKSKFCRCQSP